MPGLKWAIEDQDPFKIKKTASLLFLSLEVTFDFDILVEHFVNSTLKFSGKVIKKPSFPARQILLINLKGLPCYKWSN